ncbi:unnamed protein product [Urochloa decumbens]|uniref:AAA+ ATPase domain-containing protein n=1 Tax=Urochloa decumbens TaxID=240449 RepID=A0ABC9B119_9POAL
MASPLEMAAVGWCFTVMGWLLSPVFSLLWNKFFNYLVFDAPKKLRELEINTIQNLKQTLGDVEEQKMLRAGQGKGSRSDLETLDKLKKDLRSALYEAEDILDEIDYHRIERDLIGDRSSWVWVQYLHSAARAFIARCNGSFFGRWIDVIREVLLESTERLSWLRRFIIQVCHSMRDMFRAASISEADAADPSLRTAKEEADEEQGDRGDDIEEEGEAAEEKDREEEGEETEVLEEREAWSRRAGKLLYHWIWHFARSIIIWSTNAIANARYYRKWSYGMVGVESFQMDYSFLSFIERIHLRDRIQHIQYIVDFSNKSNMLNQQSRPKREISDEKSSSTQEINNLYRRIEREVIGRKKEREHVCSMPREGSDSCGPSSKSRRCYSMIGIHGITGSGKSTLAQYIFNYEKHEGQHFNSVMFILVPKTFRLGDIFRDMLRQIMRKQLSFRQKKRKQLSDSKDIESLQEELKKELKGKRFLLVLDDLRVDDENQKELEILLDTLSGGESGSRVLVTAQRKDAAAALGAPEKNLWPIPDLGKKEYFELFMQHALQGAGDDVGEHKRIGREIVEKLGRSPIAALYGGAIGNFDADVSRCFEYLSIFPRGYKLKQDELVCMWIAHGFVKINASDKLEDVGNHYFQELLAFSFMQVHKTFSGDKELKDEFTIHDLVHELAERVAGSDYFHRIYLNGSPKDIPPEVHHVFVETNNGPGIAENCPSLGNLRTLIIQLHCTDTVHTDIMELEPMKRNHDLEKAFECLFRKLRKLRVLIVILNNPRHTEVLSIPASIDQMKHLRHLGYCYHSWNIIHVHQLVLPSTFIKLYLMQTIKAHTFPRRVTWPEDMANLIHLRHITALQSFPNVSRLTSLKELLCLTVKEEQGCELKQLKDLNKLGGFLSIQCLGIVRSKEEAHEAKLAHKDGLNKLFLCFQARSTKDPDVEAEVLEGLWPPKYLKELTISYYSGSSYPSWMLSRQHPYACLRKLEFHKCSRLAYFPEDSELFTRLQELRIQDCDWDSLPENMEHLVSLKSLEISGCSKLELLPTLPQALRKIKIVCCGVLSTTCKEKGSENWRKIQHIPRRSWSTISPLPVKSEL